MGAILAYSHSQEKLTPATQKGKVFCFLSGLVLMFGSIIFYGNNSFPAFWALPPCLGACLYIAGATNLQSHFIEILTKNKLFVFIGVISYSLYLWHWPILVYYQNWMIRREITFDTAIILFIVIFFLSAFSWGFIEKPVRQHPIFKKHTILWGFVLICFGIFFLLINQLKFNILDYYQGYNYTKDATPLSEQTTKFKERILLVGDSHMHHFLPILNELAETYQINMYYHMMTPPYNTYNTNLTRNEIQQVTKKHQEMSSLLRKKNFETAIVSFRYDYHLRGVDIVRHGTLTNPLKHINNETLNPAEALYTGLCELIMLLQNNNVKNIYFILPIPQAKNYVPESANKLAFLFKHDNIMINNIIGESKDEFTSRISLVVSLIKKLKKEFQDITLLDVSPYLANKNGTGYDVVKANHALYFDDDHLSVEGTLLFRSCFEPIFKNSTEKK